jgi:hypothetical protein
MYRPVTLLAAVSVGLAAVSLGACGDSGQDSRVARPVDGDQSTSPTGADFHHVHGLGVNPKDGALFIATHSGLFRAPRGGTSARRVGDSRRDVMGFTVVGPDRFLGSGHPDPGAGGPPNLGLISTRRAGTEWEQVSLRGQADFHVLRSAGQTVYGFDGLTGTLMTSRDGGRSWRERQPPPGMFDLAIGPDEEERLVIATQDGLFASADGGAGWRPLDPTRAGLLTWTTDGLYLVDGDGQVSASNDGGRRWAKRGSIGGRPAAFASDRQELYAAHADGTVVRSSDGGMSWAVRARPAS